MTLCGMVLRGVVPAIQVLAFMICYAVSGNSPAQSNPSPYLNETEGGGLRDAPAAVYSGGMTQRPGVGGMVDPIGGSLRLDYTDLHVPAGPLWLGVRRIHTPAWGADSMFGDGWRIEFDYRLEPRDGAYVIVEGGEEILFPGDGQDKLYRSARSGTIDVDEEGTLVHNRVDGTRDVFDADGRLVMQDLRNGNVRSFSYDEANRLVRVAATSGAHLDFTYAGDGRVSEVTASNGSVASYRYREGRLSSVFRNGIQIARYEYSDGGRLAVVDHVGASPVFLEYHEDGRVASRRWEDGSTEKYHYLETATRVVDAMGNTTSFDVSPDAREVRVTDPLGRVTRILYDEFGQPLLVEQDGRVTSRQRYDTMGRPVEVGDESGRVERLTYVSDTIFPLTVVAGDGLHREFVYDDNLNLVEIHENGRLLLRLERNTDGSIASREEIGGVIERYEYHPTGGLSRLVDALSRETRFDQDERGNVTRRIDLGGGSTLWRYDALDRVVGTTWPDGRSLELEYDGRGNLLEVRNDEGNYVTYVRDERGRVVREMHSSGDLISYRYDGLGRVIERGDATGAGIRHEYDAAGNLVAEHLGAAGSRLFTYDRRDRLSGYVDEADRRYRFSYDDRGNPESIIGPHGEMARYQYDDNNQLIRIDHPDGSVSEMSYDREGRMDRLSTSDGRVTRYRYDQRGNPVVIAGPGDLETRFEYDLLDRIVRKTSDMGNVFDYAYDSDDNLTEWRMNGEVRWRAQYDIDNNPLWIANSLGDRMHYRYDDSGKLAAIENALGDVREFRYRDNGTLAEAVSAGGLRVRYDYDRRRYLRSIESAGVRVAAFDYDQAGNLLEWRDALGQTATWQFDERGRLTHATNRNGDETLFVYDERGRLVERQLGSGKTIRYDYDAFDNLSAIDDGVYPIRYRYNALRLPTRIEYPAVEWWIEYDYDDSGRRTGMSNAGGERHVYVYDESDKLVELRASGDITIRFEYDDLERISRVEYPNGTVARWRFDTENRPVSIDYHNGEGEPLESLNYTYDAAGDVASITRNGERREYRYDPDRQLVEEIGPGSRVTRYRYEGAKRSGKTASGLSQPYEYDRADRLTGAGDRRFAHDDNGNRIETREPDRSVRYHFDGEDRLVRVESSDGQEVRYGYAPNGDRIWREDEHGRIHYVNDEFNVIAQLDSELQPIRRFIHGFGYDLPMVMFEGRDWYVYHRDELGSTLSLSDAFGELAARYDYDAFGNQLSAEEPVANPFTFMAREYEPAAGIYYFRARYYDPVTGRFDSPDPAAPDHRNPLTLDPYAFVLNNPVNHVDPTGKVHQGRATNYEYPMAQNPANPPQPANNPGIRGNYDTQTGRINMFPAAGPQGSPEYNGTSIHERAHHEWVTSRQRHGGDNWSNLASRAGQPVRTTTGNRGNAMLAATEQVSYGKQARYLVFNRRLPIDHPEVQRVLSGFGKYGGNRDAFQSWLTTQARSRNTVSARLGRAGRAVGGLLGRARDQVRSGSGGRVAAASAAVAAVSAAGCLYNRRDVAGCARDAAAGVAVGAVVSGAGAAVGAGVAVVTGAAVATGAAVGSAVAGAAVTVAGTTVAVGQLGTEAVRSVRDRAANQRAAENREATEQANLSRLQDFLARMNARIDAELVPLGNQASVEKQRAKSAGAKATAAADTVEAALQRLEGLQRAAVAANRACANAGALQGAVDAEIANAHDAAERLTAEAVAALEMAGNCATPESGNAALARFNTAKTGIVEVALAVGRGRSALSEIQALAGRGDVSGQVAEARAIADEIAAGAAQAEAAFSETGDAVAAAEALAARLGAAGAALVAGIDSLRGGFPDTPEVKGRFDALRSRAQREMTPPAEDVSGAILTAQDASIRAAGAAARARAAISEIQALPGCSVTANSGALARLQGAEAIVNLALGYESEIRSRANGCLAQAAAPGSGGPSAGSGCDPTDPLGGCYNPLADPNAGSVGGVGEGSQGPVTVAGLDDPAVPGSGGGSGGGGPQAGQPIGPDYTRDPIQETADAERVVTAASPRGPGHGPRGPRRPDGPGSDIADDFGTPPDISSIPDRTPPQGTAPTGGSGAPPGGGGTSGAGGTGGRTPPTTGGAPPPPAQQARCDSRNEAGSNQPERYLISIGDGQGNLTFSWSMRTIKDRMTVTGSGISFSTGCVSGSGTKSLARTGSGNTVTVDITPNCDDTQKGRNTIWSFSLSCPK